MRVRVHALSFSGCASISRSSDLSITPPKFAILDPTSPQTARRKILEKVKATGGNLRLSEVSRGIIVLGRDRRRDTPSAAVNFVKVMKAMFAWAVEAELV
jgi:hypothetical protein